MDDSGGFRVQLRLEEWADARGNQRERLLFGDPLFDRTLFRQFAGTSDPARRVALALSDLPPRLAPIFE
jgi:hypothetical protein